MLNYKKGLKIRLRNQNVLIKTVTENWANISMFTDFIAIIEFCFECRYFSFNNIICEQNFGSAMGNPVSLDHVVATLAFHIHYLKI